MGVARGGSILLLLASTVRAEERDEAACQALGFAPSLLCPSCDKVRHREA